MNTLGIEAMEKSPEENALDEAAQEGGEAAFAAALHEGEEESQMQGVTTAAPLPPAAEPSRQMQGVLSPQQVPAPRVSKEQRRAEREAQQQHQQVAPTSPSMSRLGAMGSALPGAEHIKVHKRDPEDGKLGYINQYTMRDLRQFNDMETFLHTYVKPKHGPGDYVLTGVDARGLQFNAGVITLVGELPEATQPRTSDGAMSLVQQLLRERQESNEQAVRALAAQKQPDPLENMRKLLDFKKDLGIDDSKDDSSTLSAMMNMFGRMQQSNTEMMLLMMSKSDERMTQLLQAQQKRDPLLDVLLAKLLDDKSSGGNSAPLPPPLPPPSPFEGIKEIVSLLEVLRPKQNDSLTEFLLKDRMSPADMIALLKGSGSNNAPTDDFKKTAENIVAMRQLMEVMQPSSGGSGWADAISAVFSNKGIADTISSAIRARAGAAATAQRQQTPVAVRQTNAADEINARMRELHEREQRLLQAEAQLAQTGNQAVQTPQQELQPQLTQEQQEAVQRVRQVNDGKVPPLPREIAKYTNAMVLAEDDATLIGAVAEMLVYLTQQPYWDRLGMAVFNAVQSDDKLVAGRLLNGLFGGLTKIQLITTEMHKRVMDALDKHWDTVVEQVRALAQSQPEKEPPQDPANVVADAYNTASEVLDTGGLLDEEGDEDDTSDLN